MPAGAAVLSAAALATIWSLIDPQYVAVLPADQVSSMMRQCSRSVPVAGTPYWRPSRTLIAEMEAKVHDLVAEGQHADQRPRPTFPHGYTRQYVGYKRNGRHYIYGNYAPVYDDEAAKSLYWRDKPVIICDGGHHVFGVEYDVAKHTIINYASNAVG